MRHTEIFMTVGTDFHPFDRVIEWLDLWAERNPQWRDTILCQHGASRPSTAGRAVDYLENEQMLALMRNSRAVITHGGPATVFEARRQGHVPLCVPRDPTLGEHVDGHQQRFARFLAREGLVRLCLTWEQFDEELTRAMTLPREELVGETLSAALASERLEELSSHLVRETRPLRLRAWRRR